MIKKIVLLFILIAIIALAVFEAVSFFHKKEITYHLPKEFGADDTSLPNLDNSGTVPNDTTTSTNSSSTSAKPVIKLKTAKRPGSEQPLKNTPLWISLEKEELEKDNLATIRRAQIVKVIVPSKEFEIELLRDKVRKRLTITDRTNFSFPEYEFDEKGEITYVNYANGYEKTLFSTLQENSFILVYVEDPATLLPSNTLSSITPKWIVSAE